MSEILRKALDDSRVKTYLACAADHERAISGEDGGTDTVHVAFEPDRPVAGQP